MKKKITGNDSTLGSYKGEELYWWCPTEDGDDSRSTKNGISIVTSFQNFDSGEAVIFNIGAEVKEVSAIKTREVKALPSRLTGEIAVIASFRDKRTFNVVARNVE